jgi:hypothetical protein
MRRAAGGISGSPRLSLADVQSHNKPSEKWQFLLTLSASSTSGDYELSGGGVFSFSEKGPLSAALAP